MKFFSIPLFLILFCTSLAGQNQPEGTDVSVIYFYRLPDYVGSGNKLTILCDGQPVVRLKNGSFFKYTVQPGDHLFSFSFESDFKIRLLTEPGKSYYIKCSLNAGFWTSKQIMELVDPTSGQSLIDGKGLKEQAYEPVSVERKKGHAGVTMSGGIGFETIPLFVDENNDEVKLSTGGGYGIGAEIGYTPARLFDITLNCSFLSSSLSRNLRNASASFNRMKVSITPALIIPIKGGDVLRLKIGAGGGLYSFGTMKVDASKLGGEKLTFKYKSAPGFHARLAFESNFSERGSFDLGMQYTSLRYEYTSKGSSGSSNDDLFLKPNGSDFTFFVTYNFHF